MPRKFGRREEPQPGVSHIWECSQKLGQLQPRRHDSQSLLAATLNALRVAKVSDSAQQSHKKDFVDAFKLHADAVMLNQETIQFFLECLDRFFFDGSLTQNNLVYVVLTLARNIFPHEDDRVGATYRLKGVAPNQHIEIRIEANRSVRGSQRTKSTWLLKIIRTLFHEMAHAYIEVFACDCEHCYPEYEKAANVGETGHGKVWQTLNEAMSTTIGDWDEVLAPLKCFETHQYDLEGDE